MIGCVLFYYGLWFEIMTHACQQYSQNDLLDKLNTVVYNIDDSVEWHTSGYFQYRYILETDK